MCAQSTARNYPPPPQPLSVVMCAQSTARNYPPPNPANPSNGEKTGENDRKSEKTAENTMIS